MVLLAAVVYMVWLAVDLIRIGKRRRFNAIDYYVRRCRKAGLGDGLLLRWFARKALSSWWWMLLAFGLGLLLVIGIASFVIGVMWSMG